jgi:3-oxoacyl-[acyl-carrier protein] reductase
MNLSFKGKTVVVTGGSNGIGAAISYAFAEARANVVVNHLPTDRDVKGYKNLEARIAQLSGTAGNTGAVELAPPAGSCISFPGDITDSSFCNELCKKAVDSYGSLDVLVNSAGFTKPSTTEEVGDELWEAGLKVNLSAAFYLSRAALPYMEKQGKGRIIYISSSGAITGGGGAPFYSAAKAGVNGLVRAQSKELAPKGITVNAVLPALIDTDLLKERYNDPEKRKSLVSRIPVGRVGLPEDVANAVVFLASDQAGFICGQHLIVDGGSTYK